MESHQRRKNLRTSFSGSEVRRPRPVRRFFARSASTVLKSSKSQPPDDDPQRRRSFLAKPPAPGAARRVLAVLNQSQKRTPSANRKPPPSTQPPVLAPTGYEDLDHHPIRVQSQPSHHESTPSAASWNHTPPSPLKKPIAPSRHVRPLDDLPDPIRADSIPSPMPSSHPSSRPHSQQQLIDVEASEVSDELQSTTDPKSRSGRFSASTNQSPERESPSQTQELVFIDDIASRGVKFTNVGSEEAYVPSAPTDAGNQFSNKAHLVQSWAALEERIRVLQHEADEAREGRRAAERANADLVLRNEELEVLVNSFRTRTAESSAEVEELTRHLKETRRRFTRRIRELEDELASQKARHTEEISSYREWENQLRADINSHGTSVALSRAGTMPVLQGRKRRTHQSPPASTINTDVNTRALGEGITGHPAQNLHFARIRSTGNVHEHVRRRGARSEPLSPGHRPGTPNRRPCYVGGEQEDGSPRTLARRSLIRRALIAHIHSSRYRSAKNAWYDFLGAEAGNVTPDQFARAVRSLAVAADAHDRDLDMLRQEVCGAEECDTGVLSWTMFLRFYQATKNERT